MSTVKSCCVLANTAMRAWLTRARWLARVDSTVPAQLQRGPTSASSRALSTRFLRLSAHILRWQSQRSPKLRVSPSTRAVAGDALLQGSGSPSPAPWGPLLPHRRSLQTPPSELYTSARHTRRTAARAKWELIKVVKISKIIQRRAGK